MEAICHKTLSTLKGARRHDDVSQAEEEKRQGFGKEEEELAISLPYTLILYVQREGRVFRRRSF